MMPRLEPRLLRSAQRDEAISATALETLSSDQINRAGPCLVAVGLGDADIDRQIRAAAVRHRMLQRDMPAPVGLGQAIDTEPPRKPAAVERHHVVGERCQVDGA